MICSTCGNKFEKHERYGQYRSCSLECSNRKEKQRIENYIISNRNKNKKKCLSCNNMIHISESMMTTKYICSEECLKNYKNNLPKKLTILSSEFHMNKGMTKEEALHEVIRYQRERSPRCKEYWMNKGYTEKESHVLITSFQSNIANLDNRTLEEIRKNSVRCKEYWMNKGFTEEEAVKKISDIQTNNSLERLIQKHGEEIGNQKYQDLCSHLKYINSIEFYITKYGEEQGKIKFEENHSRHKSSKIADKFFTKLYSLLPKEITENINIYTNSINKEFGYKGKNHYYFYDFCIPELKIIIEFNGDFWHCNPSKYISGDIIKIGGKNFLVDDIWKYDKEKIKTVEDIGYTVIIEWYSGKKINEARLNDLVNIIIGKWKKMKNKEMEENEENKN